MVRMSFTAQACFNETLCIAMCKLFPCHIIFTSSLPEIESSFSIMEKQIDIRKPKAILNYKVGEQK